MDYFLRWTFRQKIYISSGLSIFIFCVLAFLTFSAFTKLSEKFDAVDSTNHFATQNLILSQEVQKLDALIQNYTYTKDSHSISEALKTYAGIKDIVAAHTSLDSQKWASEAFDTIKIHLDKYYKAFTSLSSQIESQEIIHRNSTEAVKIFNKELRAYFRVDKLRLSDPISYYKVSELMFEIQGALNSYLLSYKSIHLIHMKKSLKQVRRLIKTETKKSVVYDKVKKAKLEKLFAKYYKLAISEIQHARANAFLINVVMAAEADEVFFQAKIIRERSQKLLVEINDNSQAIIKTSIQNIIIVTGISFILLILISFFMTRQLTQPILKLAAAFRRLSYGDLSTTIPKYEAKDEIGALTVAAQFFKTKNEEILDLLEKSRLMTRDLKNAKKAAEQANKAKSSFLANMSHEIRTPLNAILGFISLLQKSETQPKKLEYINIVQNSSKSLLGVINDILDISKIEDGKLEIEMIDFSLKEQIEELIVFYQSICDNKDIHIKLNISANVPEYVNSDPLRLKQILSNLLSNAIKFSPEHSQVEVLIEHKDEMLEVSVTDKGIGIDAEGLEKIFKPFEQAESSTSRTFGGTGLGLSISKKLVELLGGDIVVKSVLGEGSTFSFFIIAQTVADIKPQVELTEEKFFDTHVLVVEDNKTNQLLIKILLSDLGITYSVANNGQEAVDMCEKEVFDLILMDINMPVMDGLEASAIIKKKLPSLRIIALTANAMKGDIKTYFDAGMDGFIPKPIEVKTLIQELRKHIH